jgi:ABC-type antimicrobial peptide transport system permease subunit
MNALSDDDAVEQYWEAQPEDMPDMVLIVRSAGEPGSISAQAKSIAPNLDKSVFPEIRQLKLLYRENVAQIENIAAIVSLVGLAAVSIAAIGLVGLVAFIITQRTKEIAIRMALGARPTAVLSAVLRQFQWPLAVGLIAGSVFAAFGSKGLRVALYGVNNLDPASYAAGLVLLVLIAAMSMLLPAARALRLNIASILHHD